MDEEKSNYTSWKKDVAESLCSPIVVTAIRLIRKRTSPPIVQNSRSFFAALNRAVIP